ncbi:hypothetical protein E4U43_002490 [Claviceps pusilla]|uniref:histone acetyltransferase n=1 Tax=Claviceps pusilla TaxID=123648 RepID=A0A9P7N6K2_9HYPO|nr:hypothetical protein E4U43_002490 [Claviceps pusilla]
MPVSPPSPPLSPSPSVSPAASASASPSLCQHLSSVLPKNYPFGIYHLSTPPEKTDALFSAPPNERPDRTYCEKHFLALSTYLPCKNTTLAEQQQQQQQQQHQHQHQQHQHQQPAPPKREVLVLGLELFLYTTAHNTTLFVSKADSTGYLSLLGLPRGSASPIRDVCAAFIRYLVEHRQRAGIPLVISLFARSQGQYLFPGSIDHGGKHVLDDRGLIKWWCRVLDPLIRSPPPPSEKDAPNGRRRKKKVNAQGYLLVPGLDPYETRAFIPHGGPSSKSSSSSSSSSTSSSWAVAHPLERISRYCRQANRVPPRCLIPRFPDDPKCRFRDELDDEAGLGATRHPSGSWKSVKTLDMFWEMMAYRQECSSGRMTGFIWIVLDDGEAAAAAPAAKTEAQTQTQTSRLISKSRSKAHAQAQANPKAKKPKKLKGPIQPRQPKAKTQHRAHHANIPTKSTRYYHWPTAGRGMRIVNETTYKRITELMLHSDFSTMDKAVGSTARWVREGGLGNDDWGSLVTGQRDKTPLVRKEERDASSGVLAVVVNDVGGLVKRKRPDTSRGCDETEGEEGRASAERKDEASVTVLGGGLVRKKAKTGV